MLNHYKTLFYYLLLLIALIFFSTPVFAEELLPEENELSSQKEGIQGQFEAAEELAEKSQPSLADEAKGKILRFQFERGDILEIKKFADQIITVNKEKIKRNVYNLLSLENTGYDEFHGFLFRGNFQSTFRYEEKKNVPFQEEESHESKFYIEPRGIFHVEEKVFMPNLRGLPTFPLKKDPSDKSLKNGNTWQAEGTEVLQFEGKLIPIKFQVNYEYKGSERLETKDGIKNFHRLILNYKYNHQFTNLKDPQSPAMAMAIASHTLLWDQDQGIPYFGREDYNLVMKLNNGSFREFDIKSRTFYRRIKKLNNEEVRKKEEGISANLKSFVDDKKIQVKKNKSGTVVQLQDVLFETNSSSLTKTAIQVLDKISEALKDYPNSRLKIIGHTDDTGTSEFNQTLSQDRARGVVEYLSTESQIPLENFSFQGKGEKEPIASNKTKEGRQKNRRVDIIILHD